MDKLKFMLESRREFFKHLPLPKSEVFSDNNATATKNSFEGVASRRDFIKIIGIVATALAAPETLDARQEKETSFVTPDKLRAMVLADNSERVFIAFPESPHMLYEITDRNLKSPAFVRGTMPPEIEKLMEEADGFTKIHTHPLGIYTIAGYTPDEIQAAREDLIPIPLSVPPSILDLLSAKKISEDEAQGPVINMKQEIYGTDGIWSFEGGAGSALFTEIEQVINELGQIFSSFREKLPRKLRVRYDKIIHVAENQGDAQQGFICRDINELTKNPEFAPFMPPLEEKLAKLALNYKEAFALMEEINMLSMNMTRPEKREVAMRRYLEIAQKEGFQVKFEPYKLQNE
jgi:hypothetical protein